VGDRPATAIGDGVPWIRLRRRLVHPVSASHHNVRAVKRRNRRLLPLGSTQAENGGEFIAVTVTLKAVRRLHGTKSKFLT